MSPSGDSGGAAADDPRVGTVLADRYRIDSLLGEGGMGKVYAAEHVLMRKKLAIKILHRELTSVPEVVARFEREAMAAANIEHPNVAAATDFGKLPDGSVFLVLEFVQGRNLRDEIAEGPFPVERALHITRQIARALSAAHDLEIVHRDLKPENVMLVQKGGDPDFAKVLDFGIARVPIGETKGEGKPITKVGMVFGTPEYMAPEQALGQPVDGRADLYALGVIAYEMLAGVRPFSSKSPVGILGQQLSKPPPSFAERAPGIVVPPQVEHLVLRLLGKETSERMQSAVDTVEALDQLLGPTPGKGLHKFTVANGSQVAVSQREPSLVSIPDLEAPLEPEQSSAGSWELPDAALGSAPNLAPPSAPSISYHDLSPPPASGASTLQGMAPPVGPDRKPSDPAMSSGPHPRVSSEDLGPAVLPADPLAKAKALLDRIYDFIDDQRAKLPPDFRRTLRPVPTPAFLIAGVVVVLGAVVGLIAIVAALASSTGKGPIVAASGEAPPAASASGAAPAVPSPSDAELAKARQSGVPALVALADQYPKDGSMRIEVAKAQLQEKLYVDAGRSIERALTIDPTLNTHPEVASTLWALAQTKEVGNFAFEILEGPMGAKGADIVYELARTPGVRAAVKKRADESVKSLWFQKASSPALNILVALEAATTCRQRYALLLRAKNQGDLRTLALLEKWNDTKAGCGKKGNDDCHSCLRTDSRLSDAIAEIKKREKP